MSSGHTAAATATYPSLKARGVFVTGGASGIGADMVLGFLQQGAQVAYVDIAESAAAHLNEKCASEYGKAPWFRLVDVTNAAALEAAIEAASAEMGGLDVLINNVANDNRHSLQDTNAERWRASLAVNLDAAYIASRAAIALMKERHGGAIVNVSSINSVLGSTNMIAYVSAKAGLNGMTRALAREVGKFGIRVNALLPGWVVTERQLEKWLTPEAEQEWLKLTALDGRIMPRDVTNLALFLAADDSRMITGQQFTVDAGRT
jgi:NAD(P)-dependent dehydrogenase (short-subunit alcohol dehydrogenase family)